MSKQSKILCAEMVMLCSALSLLPLGAYAQKGSDASKQARSGPVKSTEYEAASKLANTYLGRGREQLKKGMFDVAIASFRQANQIQARVEAYNGLVDAYNAKGDVRNAIATYRELIYPSPSKNWSSSASTEPSTLMRFTLLLNQTGQKDEALTVYRQGLRYLNYESNGKPNTSHLMLLELPFDGSNADNVYSPARLEAAARTALAMEAYLHIDNAEAMKQLNQALAVQPRFGQAWFYKALVLQRSSLMGDRPIKKEEITAAFANAEQLVHGSAAKATVKAQRKEYNY